MATKERRYRSDDRDLEDVELAVSQGDNGDWYLSIGKTGFRFAPAVRITTSGTPHGQHMVCVAVADLYRAMGGEEIRTIAPLLADVPEVHTTLDIDPAQRRADNYTLSDEAFTDVARRASWAPPGSPAEQMLIRSELARDLRAALAALRARDATIVSLERWRATPADVRRDLLRQLEERAEQNRELGATQYADAWEALRALGEAFHRFWPEAKRPAPKAAKPARSGKKAPATATGSLFGDEGDGP